MGHFKNYKYTWRYHINDKNKNKIDSDFKKKIVKTGIENVAIELMMVPIFRKYVHYVTQYTKTKDEFNDETVSPNLEKTNWFPCKDAYHQ